MQDKPKQVPGEEADNPELEGVALDQKRVLPLPDTCAVISQRNKERRQRRRAERRGGRSHLRTYPASSLRLVATSRGTNPPQVTYRSERAVRSSIQSKRQGGRCLRAKRREEVRSRSSGIGCVTSRRIVIVLHHQPLRRVGVIEDHCGAILHFDQRRVDCEDRTTRASGVPNTALLQSERLAGDIGARVGVACSRTRATGQGRIGRDLSVFGIIQTNDLIAIATGTTK
jgi:hypothetical protein